MRIVGLGSNIIECLRIAKMIERHGELFIERVYTAAEIQYCQSRKLATQHFAGHWAAKEAVLKALGTGWARGLGWRDIEVKHSFSGQPSIALTGGARQVAQQAGISEVLITISHCRAYATATAVATAE